MIHTDGTPTVASRTEEIRLDLKAAYRLRKLAPLTYRRWIKRHPEVAAILAEREG